MPSAVENVATLQGLALAGAETSGVGADGNRNVQHVQGEFGCPCFRLLVRRMKEQQLAQSHVAGCRASPR